MKNMIQYSGCCLNNRSIVIDISNINADHHGSSLSIDSIINSSDNQVDMITDFTIKL